MTTVIGDKVVREVARVLVGREKETEVLLVTFLAGGHALLEGVPGVSKTTLAKSFSKSLGLGFKRVQFTPDMLPLDIVGGFIFNMKDRQLEFRKGPVFTNILLADEINRAPPKVQSALLESMQEGQVTVEGRTEELPSPHMVVATQNPSEFRGVYPLPEGQLDRFMVKLTLAYQGDEAELEIVRRGLSDSDAEVREVISTAELQTAFAGVGAVNVSEDILEYIQRLATESRADTRVTLGASPRAIIQLARCARSSAYIAGRNYVIPDDIKELVPYVFGHRLRLTQASVLSEERVDVSRVVQDLLDRVVPPR